MKVFIIESPNSMDLFFNRREANSLEAICKLFGHQVFTFLAKSKRELKEIIKYISNIDKQHDDEETSDQPLCLHFSCHGNNDGIEFGKDFVEWDELYIILKDLFSITIEYEGDRILVFSSCGSSKQQFTKNVKKHFTFSDFYIPKYIFTTGGESISWDDAVLCWTVFYHQIDSLDLKNKDEVKIMLNKIYDLDVAEILYTRWNKKNKRYYNYSPERSRKYN